MKLLVLNNMSAGFGDGSIFDFVRMFSAPGDDVVIRTVDKSCNFSSALSDASLFDCIVASGGDSTIANVCYTLRYTGVPVLVFPSGTANLIAQNIMHPFELPALAKLVREGHAMDFDLGEFEYPDGHKEGFMMMAGCGFDASIMVSAESHKELFGPMAYLHAAFMNSSPTVSKINLDIDGKHIETDGVGIVAMNFSKVQFDISFGLANLPADGYLDICVLATQNAWELLLPAIGAAIDRSGKALEEARGLQYYRGKEIKVSTTPSLPVECDGEATGQSTPFTIRVLPQATKLLVTQTCMDTFKL